MKKYFLFILMGAGGLLFSFGAHAQVIGVTIPSVPQNFTATTTGIGDITLNWSASAESSGTIAGYTVYRNNREIATTTTNAYVDSGLVPGLYTYIVGAYDAVGNFSPAETAPQTVLMYPSTIPPTTVTGLAATGTFYTNSYTVPVNVTISWSPSFDNFGVTGYVVLRNGVPINSSSSLITGTSTTDSLLPGQYSYTVVAYDQSGNTSPLSVALPVNITLYMTPPSIPSDLSVQQTAPNGITLSWENSTDGVGVAGYQIYQNGTQVATTSSSRYIIASGLATGTAYAYQVAAYDNAGNVSSLSASSSITLQNDYTASAPSIATTPAAPSTAPSSGTTVTSSNPTGTTFSQSLYTGLRNQQVQALQSVLVAHGYLSAIYETGFFGSLTLRAVEQFQCAQGIVCTGGAGWGIVGPKTRTVLNGLSVNVSSTTSVAASTSVVAAEIQALQAQLAKLEGQL